MSQITTPIRAQKWTPSALRTNAKSLQRPSILIVNVGWLCVLSAVSLSMLGVEAISTTQPDQAIRQLVLLAIGIVGAAVIAVPSFRSYETFSYAFFVAVLGLLVFVLIPFVPDVIVRPRNGARRWINLGFTDFQPSELAKIAYVMALATFLKTRSSYRTLRGVLLPMVLTLIPFGLVLIEPNLGTALLFLPAMFAMLIAAGAKLRHLILVVVLGLSIAPMAYPVLQPHQKARIDALVAQVVGDTRYENDIGYQGARAMTLAGAGGLTGTGQDYARSLIVHNHLPEEHNDMIFAVICCRWGLLGAIATWLCFLAFAAGGLLTAALCKDPFGRLVAVGIVAIVIGQMTINTGMNIGLLPITGVNLPFVSYGGSSLVMTWLSVGILLNIAMRRPRYLARDSFEFESGDDAGGTSRA